MSGCVGCHGPGDEYIEEELTPEQYKWMNDEMGQASIQIGRVSKPIRGDEHWATEIDIAKIGICNTLTMSHEYTLEEAHDLTMAIARLIRAFFVKVRMEPLIEDGEGGSC